MNSLDLYQRVFFEKGKKERLPTVMSSSKAFDLIQVVLILTI